MTRIQKKLEEAARNEHIKTYDTDKYILTRVSGAMLMIATILAAIIVWVW